MELQFRFRPNFDRVNVLEISLCRFTGNGISLDEIIPTAIGRHFLCVMSWFFHFFDWYITAWPQSSTTPLRYVMGNLSFHVRMEWRQVFFKIIAF